ncbi:MAG: hypothetical protein JWO19_3892 [Bryobacterales bacterium]|nr:hypothetical protein [Bryobacterales bacterium]
MILSAFTMFHVALSLVGIAAGLVVLYGLLVSKRFDGWTTLFLTTTAATSVTGFLFPFHGFTPAIGVGIISLIVLALATLARKHLRLTGGWRRTYVITSVVALYFNVFVLVVQLFQKVPSLKALAPTQSEPPFQMTQLVVLLLFALLGIGAVVKFHPESPRTTQARTARA